MSESIISKFDSNMAHATVEDGQRWIDLASFPIEGMGWRTESDAYCRVPNRVKGIVTEAVWNLSRHCAGMTIRFVTNATRLNARYLVREANLAMDHMPATGMSGLDLYVRHEGKWRWISNARPQSGPLVKAQLLTAVQPVLREYMLYLPLYNGIEKLEIGLPPESPESPDAPEISADVIFQPAPPRKAGTEKPILFYGSSITQGGCASRPGMAYPAIVARRLDRPHYNFGYSGSARIEPETAKLLAELDPSVFVLNPLPNNGAADVLERMEQFVLILREAHPRTPILLVENIHYGGEFLRTDHQQRTTSVNAALAQVIDKLKKRGVTGLTLVPGDKLYAHEEEVTVDGVHATDLGFTLMAAVLEPVIRPLV